MASTDPDLARVALRDNCCAICHNVVGNKMFIAREMMFGYRDEFEYVECSKCGCVQITTVPEDLERFYPVDYFPESPQELHLHGLKRLMRHQRARYCLENKGILGKLLVMKYGRPVCGIFGRPDYYNWLQKCNVNFSSKILDVGCGSGTLLVCLRNDGFTNLTGVDSFIKEAMTYDEGLVIHKQQLYDLDEQFDLLMLHHTFEHMPDPFRVLRQVRNLLKPQRYALIRIPVASSFAYRRYGPHWAQLDAPRHLFLHTVDSVKMLAEQAGLKMTEVVFDSTEFQFWASEQYEKNIPLRGKESYAVDPDNSIFSPEDIKAFKSKANELNEHNDGDSACFYLYKE